ncbi:hypothetical protein KJ910_03775 [Patescibacteria group bacterium]|nr:hypothetical protein [Patescibacteria group bacterium]MBU1906967.1 hypothetical protein [Patescibacteria group bacterium]
MNDIDKSRFRTWLIKQWFRKLWATLKGEVNYTAQTDHMVVIIFAIVLILMALAVIILK